MNEQAARHAGKLRDVYVLSVHIWPEVDRIWSLKEPEYVPFIYPTVYLLQERETERGDRERERERCKRRRGLHLSTVDTMGPLTWIHILESSLARRYTIFKKGGP